MKNKLSRFAVPYEVWMAIFVVAPIVIMVAYAFSSADGGFTMDNFVQMGGYTEVFLRSFKLAIIATVLAFIFIVPAKRREKMGKFGKFLHDACNFKFLIVEKILQALYIFFTALVILVGFFMLFCSDWSGWMGGKGILLMILGPIAVRLSYELMMMAVLAVKNIISINSKLRNQNEGAAGTDIFDPDMSSLKEAFGVKEAQAAKAEPVESAPVQETKETPEQ